jgi:hypothetical protein
MSHLWFELSIFTHAAAVSGFEFGLSGAMKTANQETAGKKRVYQDQKHICNYGQVRYLTDTRGIHTVSKSFYDSVNSLPRDYSMEDYMKFIRNWGTVSSLNTQK